MRFQCPSCKKVIPVADGQYGKKVDCPHCKAATATPESAFAAGVVIGDFVIIKQLGAGGVGVVYLAHQISLDRPAALKILRSTAPDAGGDDPVQDLIREARSAAKLNHPNIVQAYAVGEDDGVFYFAMEYVDGETMKSVLKREGIIKPTTAAEIIKQIADALQFAWDKQKLTHRDIKPDNIMYTTGHQAKLADLGLSRRAGEHRAEDDSDEVMGTPQYISPEQLTGAPVDTRSDIYSLGATFYHLVTGHFPYESADVNEIAKLHVLGNLTPPKEVNHNLPDDLNNIIVKMMARYPENRYQTPGEVAKALEASLHASPAPGAGGSLRQAALSAQAVPAGEGLSGGALRQGGMQVLAAPTQGGTSLKGAFHRPDKPASEPKEEVHTIGIGVPTTLDAALGGTKPDKKDLKLGKANAPAAGSKAAATFTSSGRKSNKSTLVIVVVFLVAAVGALLWSTWDTFFEDSAASGRRPANSNRRAAQTAPAKPSAPEPDEEVEEPAAPQQYVFTGDQALVLLHTPIPVEGALDEQLGAIYMNFAFAAVSAASQDNVENLKKLVKAVEVERSEASKLKPAEQRVMNRMLDDFMSILTVMSNGRKIDQALKGGGALKGAHFNYRNSVYEVVSAENGRITCKILRQTATTELDPETFGATDRNKFLDAAGEKLNLKDGAYCYLFYKQRFRELTGVRASSLSTQQQTEFERMYFRARLKNGGAEAERELRQIYGNDYAPLQWAIRNPLP